MRVPSSSFVLFLLATVAFATPPVTGQSRRQPTAPPPPPLADFSVMEKSIEELQRALQAREVTSAQLVELYLARIRAYDAQGPALNAVTVLNPRAHEAASALDAERASKGPRGPLHGIPVLVKDNYETIEMPTSAGSIALAAFHPARDAFQVRRLKDAGAIILGKTNMHELAAGITTVGSRFGQTKNPYDLDRTPGGSSGGTGAAIGANLAAAGMGSDTCGSIRIPAANNALVGLRGTQGLSSRTGIVPLSSTQDIGGPLARSIADLAIMLDATVGADAADPQTAVSAGHIPTSYRAGLRADALQGARIGVVRSLFGTAPEDQEVATAVQKSLDALKKAGAEVTDVVIPGIDELLRDSSMIASDFKFDLMEYLAKAESAPVTSLAEILDRGLYHSALEGTFRTRNAVESRESEASRRARVKRTALRQAIEAVLNEHRLAALVYPTLRRKPARIGDGQGPTTCQVSAHSGLPALNVPAGYSADDVPLGMELLGAVFTEQQLLSLGYSIEKTLNLRRPPFSAPALVAGMAPAPRTLTLTFTGGASHGPDAALDVLVDLRYDESTGALHYTVKTSGPSRDRLSSIWIHRSGDKAGGDKPAAARHLVYAPGGPPTGTITLSASDRKDLAEGRLVGRLFMRNQPGSAADAPLRLDALAPTPWLN